MHTNSRLLFERYAAEFFKPEMQVLEIGPDAVPSSYQQLINDRSIVWHTLDMHANPRLTYPGSQEYAFAIPDGTYDLVLSGQVIEHVRKPWKWLPEVARVTKPGGLVITLNPVSWTYHEDPVDCWRIYPEGMQALYAEAALEVLLSRWESLESPGHAHYIPGVSQECRIRRWWQRLADRLVQRLGCPVERAYDTITVGRKCGTGRA